MRAPGTSCSGLIKDLGLRAAALSSHGSQSMGLAGPKPCKQQTLRACISIAPQDDRPATQTQRKGSAVVGGGGSVAAADTPWTARLDQPSLNIDTWYWCCTRRTQKMRERLHPDCIPGAASAEGVGGQYLCAGLSQGRRIHSQRPAQCTSVAQLPALCTPSAAACLALRRTWRGEGPRWYPAQLPGCHLLCTHRVVAHCTRRVPCTELSGAGPKQSPAC